MFACKRNQVKNGGYVTMFYVFVHVCLHVTESVALCVRSDEFLAAAIMGHPTNNSCVICSTSITLKKEKTINKY